MTGDTYFIRESKPPPSAHPPGHQWKDLEIFSSPATYLHIPPVINRRHGKPPQG